MDKEILLVWINKRIEESVRFLDDNGTDYDSVLNGGEDTPEYSPESENNNFEAGIISALLELKNEIETNKF